MGDFSYVAPFRNPEQLGEFQMDDYRKLLAHLEEVHIFELPVLVGVSRKSMIYKLLGGTPQDSLNGTTVLDTVALMKGAHILRVHDVREAVEAVRITEKLKIESGYDK